MSTPSTKTELLHEASRMLLQKGLNGFSLQELAEKLHIKKASLFHHYPSKSALAVGLYRFYQTAFLEWVRIHEKETPERQIIRYAEKLTTWICEKKRVCPVGALSLEWDLVTPELQEEIKNLHELHKSWLTRLFKQIDIRVPKTDAVMGTMSLIQGSIQLARINNDSKLVIKNLKTYLKSIKK
jgi:TetR/AcrR family transcriptional regulator, transcriptional repressor for nem operon